MNRRLERRLLAATVVALTCACSQEPAEVSGGSVLAAPAKSPEVFAQVEPFALVDAEGEEFTRDDLLGKPWVASFLFTRCAGPCPKVASTLKALQARLGPGARIVTFSVDPAFDSPDVLRSYAASVGADPERWVFLTVSEPAIHELIRKSFLSPVEVAPPGSAPIGLHVAHRTQLAVVDRQGRVRGFYHGESDDQLDLLLARLAFLESEDG